MTTCAIYPLLSVTLYYLGSRAKITRQLWSRYPRWLDELILGSACSSFWIAIIIASIGGFALDLPFLGLAGDAWYTPLVVGLCAIAWTPPLAWLHTASLERLGGPGGDDAAEEEP